MTVRRARPEDAPALCAMNAEFNGPGDESPARVARKLANPGGEIALIAIAEGRAVGFACGQVYTSLCYGRPVAEVTEMYVRRSARRRGAGAALLRALLAEFGGRGAREIRLLTGRDNSAARALYEGAGFRLTDEIHYETNL